MKLPPVFLLTCRARTAMAEATLQRWRATDWRAEPHLIVDERAEASGEEWGTAGRGARVAAVFGDFLAHVLEAAAPDEDWHLLLEDDLDFHPRLAWLVASWEALQDRQCGMASLFNPALQASTEWQRSRRAFAAKPEVFLGTQALLLRRRCIAQALPAWDRLPGMQSQRLARLLGAMAPIWVHRPSLVQHVAEDSSWGARVQRALDFDPAWV
jgi:hypothetical protein